MGTLYRYNCQVLILNENIKIEFLLTKDSILPFYKVHYRETKAVQKA